MILAFDTSSSACTAALFDGDGACLASRDELIDRGHSERLVPMLQEMLAGRRADSILVGTGPGSFTGIRVAVAAAHGLAIGWGASVAGMSSLALIAAGSGADDPVAASVLGGHGEIFIQMFDGTSCEPQGALLNLSPDQAAAQISAPLILGSGAAALVEALGTGEARTAWPSARFAMRLPEALRSLDARPLYARAPDAKARASTAKAA
ncbi:MAG: tRNA (adenosine(37)-N6)-threonylcarbamoyltransferase complex dimerization subunit type 1 TsaB [Sphingomicrobium sp.]